MKNQIEIGWDAPEPFALVLETTRDGELEEADRRRRAIAAKAARQIEMERQTTLL